ncbi:pseudouridine synthase [Paraferrimonas sp. SM1919]|uniref:pseudouridine synthase n=1 Tax=Paraferrimonas sp. SM1919 TaxID=2662263 RepID=UPI0013D6198F|nr:pseudouridine synthase [Paraferrimonas sp. SM1919]
MRLDKFITQATELTRSNAKKALHRGDVTVDGEVEKDSGFKLKAGMQVCLEGQVLSLIGQRYIMMHKPDGFISSTVDEQLPSALNLIDIIKKDQLHIAGRLDADTTGLLLLTDDGNWSHRITSPNKAVGKRYRVQLADAITNEAISELEQGVMLRSEDKPTRPAKITVIEDKLVLLEIKEGKYHQVKRMFAAVGNKVIGLHREAISSIELDDSLEPGQWRFLNEDEINAF